MSPIYHQLGISRLSVEDRLQLIGEIWDSLPSLDQSPIPEEHREELDRRLAEAEANPAASLPWEVVRARIENRS